MTESKNDPKEAVLAFLEALNAKDLNSAKNYIDKEVSFSTPDGSAVHGAEAYLDGWKPLGLSYNIKKAFVDGEDVCVLYDITFTKQAVTLLACGWYQVNNGRIFSINVIFNPKPLSK